MVKVRGEKLEAERWGELILRRVSINERVSWGEGDLRKWIRLRAVAF